MGGKVQVRCGGPSLVRGAVPSGYWLGGLRGGLAADVLLWWDRLETQVGQSDSSLAALSSQPPLSFHPVLHTLCVLHLHRVLHQWLSYFIFSRRTFLLMHLISISEMF